MIIISRLANFAKSADFRVVRLTPPGSPASIILGTGISSAAPGSADGLQLVVTDIEAARTELISRGAEVSEVFHDEGGVFHHAGTQNRAAGPAPDHKSYGSFVSFSDPDGNNWLPPRRGRGGHEAAVDAGARETTCCSGNSQDSQAYAVN